MLKFGKLVLEGSVKYMKVIFLIILLTFGLYSSDINQTKSSAQMFLFKIGVTSLIADFEKEKKNIDTNSEQIEALKQDIKYLLQQNLKNKLLINGDNSIVVKDNSDEDISKLKNENFKLKQYIKELKSKKDKKKIKYIKAILNIKSSTLREKPSFQSKVVKDIYRGDILYLASCNKYGWCKLKDKEGYIPKFKIKIVRGIN